ncbi:LysR family transcriptional regulator [Vibrio casei]
MSHRLPSTKELHAFVITAEELNFTSAAQRLNLTQGLSLIHKSLFLEL